MLCKLSSQFDLRKLSSDVCEVYRSPFLGQGANQALQDAFCLCNLIYKHNHAQHMNSPLWEELHRPTLQSMLVAFVLAIQDTVKFLVGFYFIKQTLFPCTSMQCLAREYESTRKFHCFLITLGARLFGMVESLGTPIGLWMKVLVLGVLGHTGILKYLFLSPMKPVV
jgi:2-polyprenyl-6-methoxyphenol hydroxylase-like FAD-dependent oxidoreductase